jgi:hypothetical protein
MPISLLRSSAIAGGAVAILMLAPGLSDARPMRGGPGMHGGFGHAGGAMSIHAPGGGLSPGGFKPMDGVGRPGGGGAGTRNPPGPPGPEPRPGPPPGPGPHPPGPGPGPGPGPHPYPPGPPPPPPPGPYWWGWDDDRYWSAAAAGAVFGATTALAASAVGSTSYVLPGDCPSTLVNGVTYFDCSDVWYQPHYVGSGVTYVLVAAPL